MEKTNLEGVFTNADYLDVSDVEAFQSEKEVTKEKSHKLKYRDRSRSPRKQNLKSHRSQRDDILSNKRYKRNSSSDSSSDSSERYSKRISSESKRVRHRVLRSLSSGSDRDKSTSKEQFKPKTNFFGDRKSKWSTVEEDELKQKEPHVIQINPGFVKELIIKPEEKVNVTKNAQEDLKGNNLSNYKKNIICS